jgi:hypothetical protein
MGETIRSRHDNRSTQCTHPAHHITKGEHPNFTTFVDIDTNLGKSRRGGDQTAADRQVL